MLARMVLRIIIILAALLLPARALADDHEGDLSGHWAFRIDDATIFVFTLEQAAGGGWQGAWTRPVEIDSNGAVFRRMSGRETVRPIEVLERGGVVQLAFAGPEPGGRRDILQFRQVSENQANLTYIGIPGDPFPLVRVAPDTPLGPFEDVRIYDRDNAVIEADYEEDAGDDGPGEAPQLAEAETEAVDEPAEEEAAEPATAMADSAGAAPAVAVDWQPLGLVDEQAAAAAATEAGLELEPLEDLALAEAEPAEAGDDDEEGDEEADEDDAPRITADFLDGL